MPTTITSAGVTFTDTTTLTSANGVPSALKLTTARTINGVSFDGTGNITIPATSISGANVTKAWVNFDGATSGTWAGGASTVTRVVGSTTATITTTNAHGLTTGNSVYVLTGVVAGSYTVTVLTSNTFTITTVATTALNAIAITFQVSSIRSSFNVSSVTKNGTGDYTVNFTTAMSDANYSVSFATIASSTYDFRPIVQGTTTTSSMTQSSVRVLNANTTGGAANNQDCVMFSVQVFGN